MFVTILNNNVKIPYIKLFRKNKEKCLQEKLFCYNNSTRFEKTSELFLGSSMAEHSAVNRRVVGSSPTRGAILKTGFKPVFLFKEFF